MSRTSSGNTGVDFRIKKVIGLLFSTIQAVHPAQINFRFQGETSVVDRKFRNLQWSLLDPVSQPSAYTDNCIQKRMRCSMSRDINRGAMVKGETVVTHKCVGTEGSKISTSDLQPNKNL